MAILRTLGLSAALFLLGCVESSSFQCERDQQCVQAGVVGQCQANKLCSYPDNSGDCASGFAYGKSAGSLAGTCVVGSDGGNEGCESPISQLSMGNTHGCLLNEAGDVYCWGNNDTGQLGLDNSIPTSTPSLVHLPKMSEISVGGEFSCAREGTGHVWCWGLNAMSQLGNQSTTSSARPVLVAGLSNAIAISSGESHGCAVLSDNSAVCWGNNANAQLGGGNTAAGIRSDVPVPVVVDSSSVPLSGLRLVAAGENHSCAASDDEVYCWGINSNGQLGDGTTALRAYPVTVTGIPDPSKVESLSAGSDFSCARTSDEELYCWGLNSNGQLGLETAEQTVPTATLVALTGVAELSAESSHSCAIVQGAVHCWGQNGNGQLGDDSLENRVTPVEVLTDARLVAVGGQHTCAVSTTGSLSCWGSNRSGQLAGGDVVYSTEAVQVALPDGAVDKLVAGDRHSCVLQNGTVLCWGSNSSEQIGDGGTSDAVSTPFSPLMEDGESLSGITSLVSKVRATCATTGIVGSENTAFCWGTHPFLLGEDPAPFSVAIPSQVSRNVSTMFLGESRVFALDDDDGLVCWGVYENGECGIMGVADTDGVPAEADQFTALGDVDQVSVGTTHSCALIAGEVRCVGRNTNAALGNLGSPTTAGLTTALVPLSETATQIASLGSFSTCAVLSDKTVECWGLNTSGQLGDGTLSSGAPRKLQLDQVESVAGGVENACAIRTDQSVWCWGKSERNLFGVGLASLAIAPVQVSPGPAKEIAVGRSHLCMINADDSRVYCLGDNLDGELGTGRELGNLMIPSDTVIRCK